MKKKKVLKKKKKCMTDLTTVTAAPTPHVILPDTQHSTYIGRILTFIVWLRNCSPLARAIVKASITTNKTIPKIGDPAPPCDSSKARAYTSYVAYCTSFGVIPRNIEDWDSLREQQRPTTTKIDSLLRHKATTDDRGNIFTRCLQCGEELTDQEGTPTPSVFAFCGETTRTQGKCKRAWLESHPPACLRRIERLVTFDLHVARSASSPFLFRGTGSPLNVEKPVNIDLTPGVLKISPEWADRKAFDIRTLKPSNKERVLPFKSRWCAACEEYVEQSHVCQQDHDAHLEHWGYYTTATALQKARKLVLVDVRRREQDRLQRAFNFNKDVYRKGSTVVLMHKAAWVQSFGGLFSHMMRRMTSLADCIVVRDLSTINVAPPSKPYAGDYVAWENSRTCKHVNLRTHTFKDGTTIKSCPNCTKFDEEREDILKTTNTVTPKSSQVREWNGRLEAEGLSEGRASFPKQLLWGDSIDLDHKQASDGEESFSHSGVNTACVAGTEDSSTRDRRAKAFQQDQNDHVTLTKSMCLFCGAELWERKGTNFCPDTDCSQRFQDELRGLNRDLLKEAQHDTLFMDLYLAINKNRKVTQ